MRDNVKGGALTEVTFFILLSLYGALTSLQKKGWIAPFGGTEGRKKEFKITPQGKAAAEAELLRLKDLTQIAETIMGGTQA